jgi:hypothetical protein
VIVAVAAVAAAVIVALVATVAVRRMRRAAPVHAERGAWAGMAGSEFASLDDAARCDLIFAVAALDDERSLGLLHEALDDPCESVALAAAHALDRQGRRNALESYLEAHPGERARRIASTLALLTAQS